MKKALKVTFGAIMAVGVASTAFAHAGHAADDFLNHSAFWIAGTYTKTSNNGLSVGDQILAQDTTNPGANGFDGGRRAIFLEPGYKWDYALGASFHIPRSHGRLFATYDHWNADESRGDTNLTNIGLQQTIPAGAVTTFGPATVSESLVEQRLNEFRLGYAHALHFSDRFCMDISAFFEYDRVKRDLHEQISQSTNLHTRDTENKVRGFGGGIGALGRVYIFRDAPCWSAFAGINHSLLYAREDYNQVFNRSVPSGFAYQYSPEQSKSVVGKMDITFGIEYSRAMHSDFNGMLFDIAAGVKMMNMYNAFKNGNTAWNPPIGDNPIAAANAIVLENFAANTGKPEDFGRWGPFIQFTLGGARS